MLASAGNFDMTLQQIRSFLLHEYALLFWSLVMCIGVFYSGALVSIATGAMMITGLIGLTQKGSLDRLLLDKATLMLMGAILVYLLSGIVSEDKSQWWRMCLTNAPYLAIPLGIHAYRDPDWSLIKKCLAVFVLTAFVSSCIVFSDYLVHFGEYNEIYKSGQTIPTPIIHVRYSYFIALSICIIFGMWMQGQITTKSERIAAGVIGTFLILFIHFLAVRTGLLALYGGLFALLLIFAIRESKWRYVLGTLTLLIGFGFAAINLMPSLKNKIGYMKYDLKQLTEQGGLPQYSDNARITSIKHGLSVFIEHPIVGVGAGDIKMEMDKQYQLKSSNFPAHRRYLPISQYMFWLSTFGLVGTAMLMAFWGYPLFKWWRHSYVLIAVYAPTLFSFVAETTIQLQLGKTLFLFVLCLVLQSLRSEVIAESSLAP